MRPRRIICRPGQERRIAARLIGGYSPARGHVHGSAPGSAVAVVGDLPQASITADIIAGGTPDTVLFAGAGGLFAADIDTGDQVLLPASPASFVSSDMVRVASGRFYAWSLTGRRVAWSDDNMQSWTEHDYGADLATTVSVEVVVKDGTETMLISKASTEAGNDVRRWATVAAPPVLSATTSGIVREARAMRGAGGEPILVGADSDDNGQIARYTGSWQKATVMSASTGTCTWATKLASGVYLAACWRYTGNAWIRRSTNFTSWGSNINNVTGAASGTSARGLLQLASGRVLWGIVRGTGNQPHIWYSDNDGVSWTQATLPTLTAGSAMNGFLQDPVSGHVYCHIGGQASILVSTNNGATWSVFGSTANASPSRPRALAPITLPPSGVAVSASWSVGAGLGPAVAVYDAAGAVPESVAGSSLSRTEPAPTEPTSTYTITVTDRLGRSATASDTVNVVINPTDTSIANVLSVRVDFGSTQLLSSYPGVPDWTPGVVILTRNNPTVGTRHVFEWSAVDGNGFRRGAYFIWDTSTTEKQLGASTAVAADIGGTACWIDWLNNHGTATHEGTFGPGFSSAGYIGTSTLGTTATLTTEAYIQP